MSVSKLSRILCLLLSLSLCFVSFGSVNVHAAYEENLIDPEFKNWTIYEGNAVINSYSGFNTIVVHPSELNGGSLPFISIFDLPSDLELGHKYQLTFNLRDDPAYIGGAQGLIGIKDCFDTYGGVIGIGLASLVTVNGETFYNHVDGCYVAVTEDNYDNFLNSLTNFTFEMPSGLINPCIMITFYTYIPDGATDVNKSVYIVFSDGFSLIDLDTVDEDNFFSRLFEWFEVKFKAIGDSFTDLKDSFVAKINDLKESFQNKIDELKQSFVDLKNDLIEGIKGLFVPDEAFVTSWTKSMEDLASERLGIIWQAGDFLVTLITTVVNLVVNAPEEISLALPAIDIQVAGMNIHLWDEQKVDFSFLETNGFFSMFYSLYKVVLNVSFGIPLLHYARKELDNTLHN